MTSSELERLLYYMPAIARSATNEWAAGFAHSILRQSRRPGWRPSAKQASMMRRLVSDLFAHPDELEIFEEVAE